jgi:hypothetical protein
MNSCVVVHGVTSSLPYCHRKRAKSNQVVPTGDEQEGHIGIPEEEQRKVRLLEPSPPEEEKSRED